MVEDARVKTRLTILQRCRDGAARMKSLVRFVQFNRPLAEIIAEPSDSIIRFDALDAVRDRIVRTGADSEDDRMRIIVKSQRALWDEGVRAGRLLKGAGQPIMVGDDDDDDLDESTAAALELRGDGYVAGKWGRYLRAPDFYFEVMRRFGRHFVPLGEIANIRRGVTSGCDAFFMPHDITREALQKNATDAEFRRRYGVERSSVENGEIKIVKAGDGSEHPIESRYLEVEVHSLMTINQPLVKATDFKRLILMVNEPLTDLKETWVGRYLEYGDTQSFASKKSKPVPVPKRKTCAARETWYDLTKVVRRGFALWPKAAQYRHVTVFNPERLIANCRLYDMSAREEVDINPECLTAVLNSTLVALWRHYYGRYTGTEGSLDTMVVDLALIEVPEVRSVSASLGTRISNAFKSLAARPIGSLVEEQLMECHSPEHARIIASGPLVLPEELRQPDRRALDDAVFELPGASDPEERRDRVDRLYIETARHFRKIRVVDSETATALEKQNTSFHGG
jgi:hypothetical protein